MDPTFKKPGSCFVETFFSHINVSFRFAGTFLFIRSMYDIFKYSRNAFDEKHNKNRNQINNLIEHYLVKSSS